tara:strand:- start:154 stop:975 length:822 start_codon:yes stop_codon:yes gene_type:complete
MQNKIFPFSNYYYNFEFNVTCILSQKNKFSKNHTNVLKAPSNDWINFNNKRQSLETMHSYNWANALGIGVVLGYNKLRALDIDNCKDDKMLMDFLKILNLPLNYQWVVKSGSQKGFHIIFYADDHKYTVAKNKIKAFQPKKESSLFKHIELRWIGHLVLPPSIHTSFFNYSFLNGLPLTKPHKINLTALYILLEKYCRGKSLNDQNKRTVNEEIEAVEDHMADLIDQKKFHDQLQDQLEFQGLSAEERKHIQKSNDFLDHSGTHIDKDEDEDE